MNKQNIARWEHIKVLSKIIKEDNFPKRIDIERINNRKSLLNDKRKERILTYKFKKSRL